MIENRTLYIVSGSHKLLAEALIENLVKSGRNFILLGRNKFKRNKYYYEAVEHHSYGCTLKNPESFNDLFSSIISRFHSEKKLFVIPCWNETKLVINNHEKMKSLFTSLIPSLDSFIKIEDRYNASKNIKGEHFKMPPSQLFPFEPQTPFYVKPRKHAKPFQVKLNTSRGLSEHFYYEPKIEGIEISANIISKNGKVFFYDSFISLARWPKTGISVLKIESKSDMIKRAAIELVNIIGWCGPLNIDFILRGDEVYVIDINPRLWASLHDNVEKNIDIIWLMETLTNADDDAPMAIVEMQRVTTHISPLVYFSLLSMKPQEKIIALNALKTSNSKNFSIKSVLATFIDRFCYAS